MPDTELPETPDWEALAEFDDADVSQDAGAFEVSELQDDLSTDA